MFVVSYQQLSVLTIMWNAAPANNTRVPLMAGWYRTFVVFIT